MMVVLVLITSCQVSLKPNMGPVTAHTTMTSTARMNVAGRPVRVEVRLANRVKGELMLAGIAVECSAKVPPSHHRDFPDEAVVLTDDLHEISSRGKAFERQ